MTIRNGSYRNRSSEEAMPSPGPAARAVAAASASAAPSRRRFAMGSLLFVPKRVGDVDAGRPARRDPRREEDGHRREAHDRREVHAPDQERDVRDEIDLGHPRGERQEPEPRHRPADEHAERDAGGHARPAEERPEREEDPREESGLGAERREDADVPLLLLYRHDERRDD